MDEASQVSVETGALALSCAKNAIIVGDTMQFPNVVTEEDKKKLDFIANACLIKAEYDCARMSFLQSVCKVIPNVPQTLLREHYRCHPKIINFCNQKFYGGNLVIMTRDKGEKDVIRAIRTAKGNHSRNHLNQFRESYLCLDRRHSAREHQYASFEYHLPFTSLYVDSGLFSAKC